MESIKEIESQKISVETAINVNNNLSSETKIDVSGPIQPHNGKRIDRIIVSQDMSYAVTYSEGDNSILGWLVNIEENGQKQPDVYFKLEQPYNITSLALHKKILLFYYWDSDHNYLYRLVDLNVDEGRFIQLKHADRFSIDENSIGFLPDGDLILVSLNNKLKDYKIYQFPFENITTLWEYSRVYNIDTPKSLQQDYYCFVYHTKLFLYNSGKRRLITQFNLLTMTSDMQYLDDNYRGINKYNIITNKSQTLLALNTLTIDNIDIFSMENGMHISTYCCSNLVEFVTLKDGSEGLIIGKDEYSKHLYEFLDPFHPSDAIDVTSDIVKNKNFKIIITKSNRKFSIIENNVWVTDGLNEDVFQQILNKTTYHSNIYTLPIFKTIQNMLKDNNVDCDFPKNDIIILESGELFRFNFKKGHYSVKVKGFKKSLNNEWTETQQNALSDVSSYNQLNNQDLALVTRRGIFIYTIVEDSLRLRYFWNNEKWNDCYEKFGSENDITVINYYKTLIKETLDNEFNDSLSSLPSPNFITILKSIKDEEYNEFKRLVLGIINDSVEFSNFGMKIFEIAVNKKYDFIVQPIFDRIIGLIESIENNSSNRNYMTIISSNLPKLCDYYYSNLVIKYLSHTSIILDPSCLSVKNSTNTSLYAYSKDIYIKKSNPSSNNYFKRLSSFYKSLVHYLQIQEETPTISFIVPFPQICKYQDDNYNSWNELLYKPKSILFCNVDNNNFYKWWNIAAIVDFKWKNFGSTYYYFIWFFYSIFFLCFALAFALEQKILFTISILLGLVHLIFEFRQFLWNPKIYLNDPWNLCDLLAYLLPIITSMHWLIIGKPYPWIIASSILFLNFKFLLFFRVFQSFGIYFAIIIGVAKTIFPFLVVLFFIVSGFAFAFFILLKTTEDFSLDQPAFNINDENNPWNLVNKYYSVNSDGTINSTPTLVQSADSNTNMFDWLPTSFLAMYLFLTGDSGSLSPWTYRENPTVTFLLVLFSFSTVIYLMNLFIGLLNMAIEDYNKYEEFLLQKAQIIMEIELFYMLPYQRHKKEWFPDWIYYDIPINEVRKLINAIDNNKTEFIYPPYISKKLRDLIEIPEPIDEKESINKQTEDMKDEFKQTKDELKQMNDELKQQIKNMQELLNSFIKTSNNNDVIDDYF